MRLPLASVLLSDTSLLMKSVSDRNREAFDKVFAERASQTLAERLRSAGFHTEIGDDPGDRIRQVCGDAGYDLSTLIRGAAEESGAVRRQSVSWFPWELFQDTPFEDRPEENEVPQIADAHLHSGAAIDLRSFCSLLMRSARPLQSETIGIVGERTSYEPALDLRGSAYDAVLLVHAVRQFL